MVCSCYSVTTGGWINAVQSDADGSLGVNPSPFYYSEFRVWHSTIQMYGKVYTIVYNVNITYMSRNANIEYKWNRVCAAFFAHFTLNIKQQKKQQLMQGPSQPVQDSHLLVYLLV